MCETPKQTYLCSVCVRAKGRGRRQCDAVQRHVGGRGEVESWLQALELGLNSEESRCLCQAVAALRALQAGGKVEMGRRKVTLDSVRHSLSSMSVRLNFVR